MAALVLAAGRSARYRAAGGPAESKLVDLFAGEPLVRHPARAALGAGLAPVVVVTGHAAGAVRAALDGLPVRLVHNADFATGLASSLRAGLAALGDAPAALVLLGDMPLVTPALIEALVAGWAGVLGADAAVPVTGEGERGNPVLLARAIFAAAARLTGDEGARRLLRDPALTVVEVPAPGLEARLDIDEPAGLAERQLPEPVRPFAPPGRRCPKDG